MPWTEVYGCIATESAASTGGTWSHPIGGRSSTLDGSWGCRPGGSSTGPCGTRGWISG